MKCDDCIYYQGKECTNPPWLDCVNEFYQECYPKDDYDLAREKQLVEGYKEED